MLINSLCIFLIAVGSCKPDITEVRILCDMIMHCSSVALCIFVSGFAKTKQYVTTEIHFID